MANPTRQQIINAHEALSNLAAFASRYAEDMVEMNQTLDWNETIKAALPPKPQPTMADVEWDDNKHYLAEAKHVDWGKVVMLYYDGQSNRIQYFCKLDEPNMVVYSDPANLTPTGKRYTLTEAQDD